MQKQINSLLTVVVLTVGAYAQTSRGTVSGTITDPTGALVAGATIALTHTETGVRRVATTNEAGIYRFDAVDLGDYEIKVTQPGFHGFLATTLGVEEIALRFWTSGSNWAARQPRSR